eukprot:9152779-Pyramimonas_sp.AAC.1
MTTFIQSPTPLARGRAHTGREGNAGASAQHRQAGGRRGRKRYILHTGGGAPAHVQKSRKSSVMSAHATPSCAASCQDPM